MTTTDEAQSSWELETGLAHDVDAWIANARFGLKEEYASPSVTTTESFSP